MQRTLRVGTRGSALALAQSSAIADEIAAGAGCTVELVRVRTEGDVNAGPLATIGGTGVFVTAVREALARADVDIVVHSFKDLPTEPPADLTLAAVPVREDPFDALCARDGRTLERLPPGATVGTGSPRRAAQLLLRRKDLRVVAIRGNVDTRLRMVTEGRLDAVVLAVAGLARLGRLDAITHVFGPDEMLPAPAQGALAVECRSADMEGAWFAAAVRQLDHQQSRSAVVAERAVLAELEVGCSAPIGAHATVFGDVLTLSAVVVATDGTSAVRAAGSGSMGTAADLGREVASSLLSDGALNLFGSRP